MAGRPDDHGEPMEAWEWKPGGHLRHTDRRQNVWEVTMVPGGRCVGGNNGSSREQSGLSPEGMVAAKP